MFCLPTTKDGMNAAIGQYIHGRVAANIQRDTDAAAARVAAAKAADPNWTPDPFVWDTKFVTKTKRTDAQIFADYCAKIRARKTAS